MEVRGCKHNLFIDLDIIFNSQQKPFSKFIHTYPTTYAVGVAKHGFLIQCLTFDAIPSKNLS